MAFLFYMVGYYIRYGMRFTDFPAWRSRLYLDPFVRTVLHISLLLLSELSVVLRAGWVCNRKWNNFGRRGYPACNGTIKDIGTGNTVLSCSNSGENQGMDWSWLIRAYRAYHHGTFRPLAYQPHLSFGIHQDHLQHDVPRLDYHSAHRLRETPACGKSQADDCRNIRKVGLSVSKSFQQTVQGKCRLYTYEMEEKRSQMIGYSTDWKIT